MNPGYATQSAATQHGRVQRTNLSVAGLITVAVLTAIAALGLVIAQQYNIRHGQQACLGSVPDLDAGEGFASTFEALARLFVYELVLVGSCVGLYLLGRHDWKRFALPMAGFVVLGAMLFWLDYRLNNGLSAVNWQAHCPSGHPPGWPRWTGIHPRP